jgi:hypothetical protein
MRRLASSIRTTAIVLLCGLAASLGCGDNVATEAEQIVIRFPIPALELRIGAAADLDVVDDAGASARNRVVFRVVDSTIARLIGENRLTGLRPGATQVVAILGNQSASLPVTVLDIPVDRVTIAPDSLRLYLPSGRAAISVTLLDSADRPLTGRRITYRSSDAGVATVDSTGDVRAVSLGRVSVIATAEGRADTAIVNVVPVPVSRVTVSADSVILPVPGPTATLTALTADSAGGSIVGRPIEFRSANSALVSVSAVGGVATLTPLATGSTLVIATSEGVADTTRVIVRPASVGRLLISPDTLRLVVPGVSQSLSAVTQDSAGRLLTGRPVSYVAADTTIARVSATGVVQPIAVGTTRVIGAAEVARDTVVVVVQPAPVARVLLSPDSIGLFVPRGAATLTTRVEEIGGAALTNRVVTYRSTATGVATVSSAGLVDAIAVGRAFVVATAEGVSDSTIVDVRPVPVSSVLVTPNSASVPIGTTSALSATARDSAGGTIVGRAVSWSSLNTAIATVSPATGGSTTVSAVALGTTTVRATVDGVIGASTITVTNPPVPFGGSVATAGGTVVGGGVVQIFDATGSQLQATATVSGGGAWSVTTLPAGTYRAVLQPPPSHSMGPTEAAFRTITTPGTTTLAFVVQPAVWFDDFQSYADSAALHTNFGSTSGALVRSFFPPGQITLDPSGGPGGSRAMRYNFRVNGATNQDLWTVVDYRGPTTAGPNVDTLWFRFTTRESPGFETGCATCGNFAYKFFLVGIGRSTGYPNTAGGRFGMYLQGPANAQTMGADMNDRNPDNLGYAGHLENARHQLGANTSWTGTWNTWMVRIAFTTPTTATMTLFRNGQQIATTLTNRFLTTLGDRQLLDIELGSTLNSGPTVPQQRWWREVGVYRTRPSMLPSFPLVP